MPKRIVDGEGLWMSPKVRSLPAEYRLHYANWLPLAEANGAFEADTHRILSKVYSYILPEITEKKVKKILNELKIAGLIEIYEQNGKTWGYFTGIEKGGRLPPESQLKRYKGLPPLPPRMILGDGKEEPSSIPQGFGLGLDRNGLVRTNTEQSGQEEETEMAFIQNLENTAAEIFKFRKGMSPTEKKEYKLLGRAYDTARVEDDFRAWAEENRSGEGIKYPFSLYLKKCDDRLKAELEPEIADDPRIRQLSSKIYELTGRLPVGVALTVIQKLLTKHSVTDIIAGFSEYLSGLDSFEQKWAVKNFFSDGAGDVVIENIAKRRALSDKMTAQVAREINTEAEQDRINEETKAAERKAQKEFEAANADQI